MPNSIRILLVLSSFSLLFYIFYFYNVDSNHVAISRDLLSGKTYIEQSTGWQVSSPWVQVVKIDTRPFKICLTSTTSTINCRLVQFDTTGWKELIARESFQYYWFRNRLSFNFGYQEEYRGFKDILRGYTFNTSDTVHFIRFVE
jgi:hypothetical protein